MDNTKRPKVTIAQVKYNGRVVYENPVEMYKIRYNSIFDEIEKKIDTLELKEAKDILQRIKEQK